MERLKNKGLQRVFGEVLDLSKKRRRFNSVASSRYPSAGCSSAEPASVSRDSPTLSEEGGFVKDDSSTQILA
jgi:hypothetical protein